MEKSQNKIRAVINILAYGILLFMMSCQASFEPIDYGRDACTHCKMTIVDKRFASEIVTGKGRTLKFDDVHCLKQYLQESGSEDSRATFYIAVYTDGTGKFIDATKAFYLKSEKFKSPMNGDYAAFASEADAQKFSGNDGVEIITWQNVK